LPLITALYDQESPELRPTTLRDGCLIPKERSSVAYTPRRKPLYTSTKVPRGSMRPSTEVTEAVRDIVRMVRPELTEPQAEAAADVLAANLHPEAEARDPAEVRRTREAVAEAIARHSTGESASLE
jgi:hypothetical protein